tara:strand:- start:215 stop:1195 length:981 start_codon:yes stop_codon:yes gene_type:complete
MTQYKIVSLRPEKDFANNNASPPSIFDVKFFNNYNTDVMQYIKKADAVIMPAVGEYIDSYVFENSKIKIIQITGAGFDRISEKEIRKLNINVCNISGVNSNAVAEFCVGSSISLLRSFKKADKNLFSGDYSKTRDKIIKDKLFELNGLKVSIIGLGPIGKTTAKYFKMFGCKVFCHDIYNIDTNFLKELDSEQVSLNDALKFADIISFHLPLNSHTKNLLNKNNISFIQPSSIIINASRGGIINENDLAKALKNNDIRGAAIDVFQDEPIKPNNPILNLPEKIQNNVILTPHIAGITKQSWNQLFKESWLNIENCLLGKPFKYLVN